MSQESTTDGVNDTATDVEEEQLEGAEPSQESDSTAVPRFEFNVAKGAANQELLRLRAEHPEFYQELAGQVGQRSANRYRRELRERDTELANYRKTVRWNEIAAMDEKEVQQKFDTDPGFAKEFAELRHWQPQQAVKQPERADDTAQMQETLQELWSEARANGLDETALRGFGQGIVDGKYGDETEEHWTVIVSRMGADMGRAIERAKGGAGTTQSEQPKTNQNLLRGSGDLTRTGGGSAVGTSFPKTLQEYKNLPAKQRMALIASDEGEAQLDKLLASASKSK